MLDNMLDNGGTVSALKNLQHGWGDSYIRKGYDKSTVKEYKRNTKARLNGRQHQASRKIFVKETLPMPDASAEQVSHREKSLGVGRSF